MRRHILGLISSTQWSQSRCHVRAWLAQAPVIDLVPENSRALDVSSANEPGRHRVSDVIRPMTSTLARQPFLSSSALIAQSPLLLSTPTTRQHLLAPSRPFSNAANQKPLDPSDKFPEKQAPPSCSPNEVVTTQSLATQIAMIVLTPVFLGVAGAATLIGAMIAITVGYYTFMGFSQAIELVFGIK